MDDETPLADAELEAIEARCGATTLGPWRSWIEGRDHTGGDSLITTGRDDIYIAPPGTPEHPHDQDMIASARQNNPRLVTEIRRLRRVLGQRPNS